MSRYFRVRRSRVGCFKWSASSRTTARVSEDQKITLATFYLTGEALKWFQWLHATAQVRDWASFAVDAKKKFGPSVYYSPETMINKLVQSSSVAVYIAEFESLSTRTPDLTPDNLLHRFVAGLKDEIHNEIVLLCPNTLQAAKGMSRVAENSLIVLIDGGSTHNFLQTRIAKSVGLVVETTRQLSVTVGNGEDLQCEGLCGAVPVVIGGKSFAIDFYLLPIYGVDAVLGAQWLAEVGPVCFDYSELWLSFTANGEPVVLHGIKPQAQFASLTLKQLKRA